MTNSRDTANLILQRLSESDFLLLRGRLERVDLPLRKLLETRRRPISNVYFFESGFASVVALDARKTPVEVGMIGREGMSGLNVIFRSVATPDNDTYMQSAGHGWFLPAKDLSDALDQSPSLHKSLLKFANSFVSQVTRTVVANGRGTIEERLARWLLMAEDRLGSGPMLLTQEFLAMMLAVQRTGVTVAITELERKGLVARRRGQIEVLDRSALMLLTNGTYIAADYE